MTNLQPVSIPKRLYAFAIDLGVVTLIKITVLKVLSNYLYSILPALGRLTEVSSLENQMTVFVFTLFPLIWVTYISVATYVFGSTLGTRAFGYHFIRLENTLKLELTFAQSLQRSLIMLTCIYTAGVMATVVLFRQGYSKVVTDLVENVFAVYDKQIDVLELSYLPSESTTKMPVEVFEKKDAA